MRLPITSLAFGGGLAGGVLVTRRIHRRRDDFWSAGLGSTRLRRGDLPVGGIVTALLSLVAPAPARPALRAMAAGAALGVAVVAATDPLPSPALA